MASQKGSFNYWGLIWMEGNRAPLRVHTHKHTFSKQDYLGYFSEKEAVLGWLIELLKGPGKGVTLFGKSHSQAWFLPPTPG